MSREYIIDDSMLEELKSFVRNSGIIDNFVMELNQQIVRCRDCKLSRIADGSSWPANKHKQYIGKTYCIKWGDGYAGEWVKPDGYCAWGKRRE